MFTHPLDQQEYERKALARSHPEVYDTLIGQGKHQKASENPDVLDRLIGKIRVFFHWSL
jgi:hypothetical protein